jgi:succinate-semialdehyde dehydrogenase/glutarate-semialdehyde dehydrogenase
MTTANTTGELFEVRNPRTGEVDYRFHAPAPDELTATLTRLRAAQRDWFAMGLEARIEVLRRWRAEFAQRQSEITDALAADTGRYLIATSEVRSVLGMVDRWSAIAPSLAKEQEMPSASLPHISYRSQYVPYSLVGIISPWNFPVSLCFIDAIPALLAGCAVFIKPSEVTPRFTEPAMRAIEAIPELAAVWAIQPGGRETGEALVAASDVVCFTGSVATGRQVAENAARHFIPSFLELGGNDPLIIMASADIERASDVALRSTCLATGQACQSIERVYVHRSVYPAFVERLVAKASQVEPNWPDIHQGTIGPFIFAKQAEVVAGQLADAVQKGARVLTGGEIEDHGGKWLRPTVLVDVTQEMAIMREETFGPVIPVMAYDDVEQAIEWANEGVYGLSAGVIAGSLEEAEQIGREIDAGGISLNDGSLTAMCHEMEKHSFKLSGMGGSRMGPAGYTRFFRRKVLIRQHGEPATMAHMAEANAVQKGSAS